MKSANMMETLTGVASRSQTTGGIVGDVLTFPGPGAGNLTIEPGDFVAAVVLSHDKIIEITDLFGLMKFTFETTLFEEVAISIRPRQRPKNDYENNSIEEQDHAIQ